MLRSSLSSLFLGTVSISLLSLASCATSGGEFDELAGESETDDASSGKADSAVDGSYTYFAVRGDVRRCASPMCGGTFFERLNRSTTVCHDGSVSARCYSPVLDWSESGLGAGQQEKLVSASFKGALSSGVYGIVRGRFAKKNTTTPRPELGRFIVTEAWVAEGEVPSEGVFARIKDAGIRCITTPCSSIIERGLNTSRHAMLAGLDFEPAQLTDRQVEGFYASLVDPSGILVAGDRYTFMENGSRAKGRTATAAYHRLAEPVTGTCFTGGCSGQICSDQEGLISTCEWREEYACYQTATCERQSNDECGWTETPELTTCLAN